MKLSTRLFISFILVIFMPVILSALFVLGFMGFRSKELQQRYGIDVANLAPDTQSFIAMALFYLVIILIITAVVLSLWIYSSISSPLYKLTKATHSIRDGELDFSIQPEGALEVRELCEDFEEMRKRLKQANEESAKFDQENRELISNISHDLKTPITAVKGYVEGIMDGVADTPEKMDRYIRTIYTKANEMDHLINELTFYSKIDTNRIPYNFNTISVDDFFGDAADELQMELEQKKVRFSYVCRVEKGARIIADAEQIRRVISNIISNALKYMDKAEKHIDMRVIDCGDDVQIEIEDNGRGIAAKDLSHIFDRFFRTDSSRNSGQGGSGIGLSIVKKIMEDHGGRVWATSREGEGTTMCFVLRKYKESR